MGRTRKVHSSRVLERSSPDILGEREKQLPLTTGSLLPPWLVKLFPNCKSHGKRKFSDALDWQNDGGVYIQQAEAKVG